MEKSLGNERFFYREPTNEEVPLFVSIPHSGFEIPDQLSSLFKNNTALPGPDVDWFVDRLYDFVPSAGGHLIHSRYHRYVIDLNRPKDSRPLYGDGRLVTELVPTKSFAGESLYEENPDSRQIQERIENYYRPYHEHIEKVLSSLVAKFGTVVFIEGHSIRRYVPKIYSGKLPDLILGDADGESCAETLSKTSLDALSNSGLEVAHNHPFRGGYLTRHFGRPAKGIHALQLEKSQDIYMNETNLEYDFGKAEKLKKVLEDWLLALLQELRGFEK